MPPKDYICSRMVAPKMVLCSQSDQNTVYPFQPVVGGLLKSMAPLDIDAICLHKVRYCIEENFK